MLAPLSSALDMFNVSAEMGWTDDGEHCQILFWRLADMRLLLPFAADNVHISSVRDDVLILLLMNQLQGVSLFWT